MIAVRNRTYPLDHTLYKSDSVERGPHVIDGIGEGHVVKDFKLGDTRIKICDDYCQDKTPEAIQTILDRIAPQTQTQLAIQELPSQPNRW